MIRLQVLLENSDDATDRLMRAELHRELGEFDLALAEIEDLLGPDVTDGQREAALKIGSLARSRDRHVREWG